MAPPFGRFPGPGLPPTIPPGGAPFALNAGAAVHPTAAFSAEAYGVSGVPERPKKVAIHIVKSLLLVGYTPLISFCK